MEGFDQQENAAAAGSPDNKFSGKKVNARWSREAEKLLVEKWHEIHIRMCGANLSMKQWAEVSKSLKSHNPEYDYTVEQCRDKVQNLKRLYRILSEDNDNRYPLRRLALINEEEHFREIFSAIGGYKKQRMVGAEENNSTPLKTLFWPFEDQKETSSSDKRSMSRVNKDKGNGTPGTSNEDEKKGSNFSELLGDVTGNITNGIDGKENVAFNKSVVPYGETPLSENNMMPNISLEISSQPSFTMANAMVSPSGTVTPSAATPVSSKLPVSMPLSANLSVDQANNSSAINKPSGSQPVLGNYNTEPLSSLLSVEMPAAVDISLGANHSTSPSPLNANGTTAILSSSASADSTKFPFISSVPQNYTITSSNFSMPTTARQSTSPVQETTNFQQISFVANNNSAVILDPISVLNNGPAGMKYGLQQYSSNSAFSLPILNPVTATTAVLVSGSSPSPINQASPHSVMHTLGSVQQQGVQQQGVQQQGVQQQSVHQQSVHQQHQGVHQQGVQQQSVQQQSIQQQGAHNHAFSISQPLLMPNSAQHPQCCVAAISTVTAVIERMQAAQVERDNQDRIFKRELLESQMKFQLEMAKILTDWRDKKRRRVVGTKRKLPSSFSPSLSAGSSSH